MKANGNRELRARNRIAIGFTIAAVIWTAAVAGAEGAEPPPAFAVEVTGEGPPMVLIPGLASSGEVWEATVERYRDHYRLHVLTLAGFAGQPPIAPPLLATARDQLVRYLEGLGEERPVLVGHSLGGFLALWVAATVPDRVAAVVAVDGVPFLPALVDPAATADGVRPLADQRRQLYATWTPEQLLLQSRIALATMITDPADVEEAVRWSAASHPSAVGHAMAEAMTTDLRATVAAIEAPVLLIAAAEPAADERMRESLRESYEAQLEKVERHRVVLATEARHFVMLDDPDFLHAVMDDLLTEATRGEP